jgi:putative peptide maturation system protein
MRPPLGDAVAAAVEAMSQLAETRAGRACANAAVADLRRRFAGVRFRLLAEREAYGRREHFELLVDAEGPVVALRVVDAGDGIPFVIRRAYRPPESCILTVNGHDLQLADAVALMMAGGDEALRDRFVDYLLVGEAASELGVADYTPSASELRLAVDALRRTGGLADEEAFAGWLRARGMERADLERRLADQLRFARLKLLVVGDDATRRFYDADPELLDEVWVESYRFATRTAADDFAAHAGGRATLDERVAVAAEQHGFVGHELLRRRLIDVPQLRARDERSFAPPTHDRSDWSVARISRRCTATWNAATQLFVRERLFAAWLQARRAGADVQWRWGAT